MIPRSVLILLPLILLSLFSFVSASSPTSFCKCTCFSNSTIIQLGPPDSKHLSSSHSSRSLLLPRADETDDSNNATSSSSNSTSSDNKDGNGKNKDEKKLRTLNCNDCNRKFCLDYGLPKCKGAKEEDVFTTCFQRDSNKDKAVVFIFIIATAGLLLWAAIRPWAEKWIAAARERRSYIPVSGGEDR